ncbi:MAG: endonuclease [Pirellulaceae bacterium]|nr:endonuclease [Pirellulaceae bacterium]
MERFPDRFQVIAHPWQEFIVRASLLFSASTAQPTPVGSSRLWIMSLWGVLLALMPFDASAQESAGQSTSQNQSPPEKLTVMTWNVEWFYDEHDGDNFSKLAKEKTAPTRGDWDWHRDAVARSISRAKPSILALQEVENRRVLWYLSRALDRDYKLDYTELCDESTDHFTEQDVGLMFRSPVEVLQTSHFRMTSAMKSTEQYYDLSKHILAVFQVPNGTDQPEHVTVMNVHLRSRAEGESIRVRQARLIHHWIKERVIAGENVILLGDTNTEESGDTTRLGSDLGVVSGLETETPEDDLIDLHLRLSPQDRRTHLLAGKEFDRIFVSRSLLEDDPDRPDLVFTSIKVLKELSIQGEADSEAEHWEQYWKRAENQRDISDHYPVQATFEIR